MPRHWAILGSGRTTLRSKFMRHCDGAKGCHGPQLEFPCNVRFFFVDCPTQVPIKCDITWVVLPMVNLRQVRKTASAGSEPNQKGRGKGVAKGGCCTESRSLEKIPSHATVPNGIGTIESGCWAPSVALLRLLVCLMC